MLLGLFFLVLIVQILYKLNLVLFVFLTKVRIVDLLKQLQVPLIGLVNHQYIFVLLIVQLTSRSSYDASPLLDMGTFNFLTLMFCRVLYTIRNVGGLNLLSVCKA